MSPSRLPPSDITFPLSGGYVSLPTKANPMRSYQYNLSYQRQLMERVLLDVTYTGNQQRNIWIGGYAENPAVYIPGNCVAGQYALTAPGPCSNTSTTNQQARAVLTLLNPTEGKFYNRTLAGDHIGIQQGSDQGYGHYNGLKIGIQKRMSSGWSANTNYTLSKCINVGNPSQDINWTVKTVPEAPDYKIEPDYKYGGGRMLPRSPPCLQPELRDPQPGGGQRSGACDHEGLASRPDRPGAQRLAVDA